VGDHDQFPYTFSDTEGITFGEIPVPVFEHDLRIYYSSMAGNDFVSGLCSRWDTSNYQLIVETWLKKDDVNTLFDYMKPGAVGELYKILGRPTYYDKTWGTHGMSNTLRVVPTGNSQLQQMREEKIIYVKNVTTHPIAGSQGWIEIKLEGYLSGSQNL